MNNYKRYVKARRGVEKWIHKVGRVLMKAQKYSIIRDRKIKEYEQVLQEEEQQ